MPNITRPRLLVVKKLAPFRTPHPHRYLRLFTPDNFNFDWHFINLPNGNSSYFQTKKVTKTASFLFVNFCLTGAALAFCSDEVITFYQKVYACQEIFMTMRRKASYDCCIVPRCIACQARVGVHECPGGLRLMTHWVHSYTTYEHGYL
jgi:hypothetical protein